MISIAGIHRRIKRALSSRSAWAWLLEVGWNWKEVKKGVYRDGHESQEVREYRDNIFLPQMQSLEPLMRGWDADLEVVSKPLVTGVWPIVFITHDECTFNSNNRRRKIWIHEDNTPIRKKGRGQGLHISDLLAPVGRLAGGAVCETLKCGGEVW